MSKFIQLTLCRNDNKVLINIHLISSIEDSGQYRHVRCGITLDANVYESLEEIKKLINEEK